jgi:hypothetical protein
MPSKTASTSTTFTGTAIVDPFDLGGAPTGTSQLGGSEFDVFS